MSHRWSVLFIINWKISEINFLSGGFLIMILFLLIHFLLKVVVEVSADFLPGVQCWSHLVEERVEVWITVQEVVELFLELSIVQFLALILFLLEKLLLDDMNKLDELLVSAEGVHVHVDALLGTDSDGGSLLEIFSLQLLNLSLRLTL